MKRIIYIILVIIALAIVAWLLLFFFKKSPTGTPAAPASNGALPNVGTQSNGASGGGTATGTTATNFTVNASSSAAAAKFGVVSNEPVEDYFVDAEGNVTAVEPDGEIVAIANGQASSISSSTIQSLIGAAFSSDGKKIAVSFGDVNNPQASVFDVAAGTWTPLPVGASSPVWAPSRYVLDYLATNANGTESLMTLDASSAKNKPSVVVTLHLQDGLLDWINKNEIAISEKPSVYAPESTIIYDAATETFTPVALDTPGLETLWSHTTSTIGLQFSSENGGGGSLQLLDPASGVAQQIAFLTLPTKCAFGLDQATTSPTLYCAVPQDENSFAAALLPDAYDQMAIFTADSFYEVNTGNGALTSVLAPSGSYDATNLKVFNDDLFFVNRYDQKLYAISLGLGE